MFIFPVSTPNFVENPPRRENFCPIGAQCATRAGNWRQFCVKVWRADSDAISVRTLTPEIFPRTSVLYPRRWLAGFLAFCCIAFCEGDLLSRFLLRVFFVSLKTLSAENLLEPGSYAVCCCGVERFSAGN